jgi:hypothetical protein
MDRPSLVLSDKDYWILRETIAGRRVRLYLLGGNSWNLGRGSNRYQIVRMFLGVVL